MAARRTSFLWWSFCIAAAFAPATAHAFIFDTTGALGRWTTTSLGSTGAPGNPATLSWSIVPDGTVIPATAESDGGPSNLIATLDDIFGGPTTGAVEDRVWFRYFEESFDRFSQLSGLSYFYERNDDGSQHGLLAGQQGVRGDVRIGGINIDGPGDIIGYNSFPNDGDMVLDTSDTELFANPADDNIRFRNLIMHEHGHGLGLQHVDSTTDALLMESFIQASFDGPQLDEVRAIQFHYGDANEKLNNGNGNDFVAYATPLGELAPGQSVAVGTDANIRSQRISAEAVDFVSIDHASDVDYYSFSILEPATLDAALIPRGGVFTQSAVGLTPTQFDANARVDLILDIYDETGTGLIALADSQLAGGVETLSNIELPEAGTYYARVSGIEDTIQLYELELAISNDVVFLPADFNQDGDVNGADLTTWEIGFGGTAVGDADEDLDSDGADLLAWQRQLGQVPADSPAAAGVPEPAAAALATLAVAVLAIGPRRCKRFAIRT